MMKILLASAVATAPLLNSGLAWAQSGNMMNGGMWDGSWMGGYGGSWVPILLVAVVVGLVVGAIRRKGN